MSDWWAGAIKWTIWAIVMTAVMAWLARSRLKPRAPADSRRLHHPAPWWTTGIFVGFAVMSVPIMLDYFLARHDVSDEGLSYGRMLGVAQVLLRRAPPGTIDDATAEVLRATAAGDLPPLVK